MTDEEKERVLDMMKASVQQLLLRKCMLRGRQNNERYCNDIRENNNVSISKH